jgi:hypothetical protein
MQLHYLDFDFSDEVSGHGSFDAMASVLPDRLPALLAEIGAVLGWALATCGAAGAAQDDEGVWDYELQGVAEPGAPLVIAVDSGSGEISLAPAAGRATRTTWPLTVSGSHAFCEALRDRFGIGD